VKIIDWGPDLKVSQLCFGSLVMGPLQRDIPPEKGAEVIKTALDKGVNFIDTAQSYRTYEHIRLAIKDRTDKIYLATKSHAKGYAEKEEAIKEALEKMEVDHIDVFHLHAPRATPDVFRERKGALECLHDYKEKGIIGRVGIATHAVPVVNASAEREDIDIVFPIINLAGMGILQGNRVEMEKAIVKVNKAGKPLYAMKVFGGGNLMQERKKAVDYALSVPGIEVLAIGMASAEEIEVNIGLLKGEIDQEMLERTAGPEKMLKILNFCTGCGTCIEHCPSEALDLAGEKCEVDRDKCILCGYCAPHCPEFAIRVV